MLHRPLIWFSAAFALGCGVVLWFEPSVPLAVCAILLAVVVFLSKWNEKLLPICLLIGGLVCGVSYTTAYHRYVSAPISDLEGTKMRLTVTATDFAVQYDNQQRVEVKVTGSDVGCHMDFRTLLYLPLTEDTILPGDSITGKVEFYVARQLEGFDRESYNRAQGYFIMASIDREAALSLNAPEHRPFSYYPKQFARSLRQVFESYGTERQSAFWSALITGDRSQLTTADTDALRKAGLSHIIALSGLHVGFLISLLLIVFGKRVGTALGIPMLIAFYLMVGWSPSVVRACIMYGILLLAFWIKREADSVNSLFAALLFILIFIPDALYSVSLQLSFVSTLGIICFSSRIQHLVTLPKQTPRIIRRFYRICMGVIACSICAMIFTAPILLYQFGYISVFSVVSNVLVMWAVSLAFPLLALGGCIGMVWPSAASLVFAPASWLTDYMYLVMDKIAQMDYGVLYRENSLDLWVAVLLCAAMVVLLRKARTRILLISLPLLLALVIGISVLRGANGQDDVRIAVLPEGSGQAIVVSCGDQAALIDCSGSGYHDAAQDVADYLNWWGIDDLDLLILTSVDLGHARNVCALLDTVSVKQVILPAVNRENKEPYPAVMDMLIAKQIPYEKTAPDTETAVGDSSLGLSILGSIERKLVVRLTSEDQNILIVHALTQNMLLELTDQTSLGCHTLVVSGGFSDSTDKMTELLKRISPQRIVLENGWNSASDYQGVPILNPYQIGQIDWKTVRK